MSQVAGMGLTKFQANRLSHDSCHF